jgi:hypothetical protein
MTDDLIKRIEQAEDAIGYAVDALEVQAERIAELEDAEVHLGNLLARIHRDGGHYQAQHGTFKAVGEAEIAWYELMARAEKAEADLAAARKALRHASDGPWHGEHDYRNWHEQHATAIAAARGEKADRSTMRTVVIPRRPE